MKLRADEPWKGASPLEFLEGMKDLLQSVGHFGPSQQSSMLTAN